jgi:elongation of very long chain fatty acids protein 4
MTDFTTAFAIALGYLAFVFVGRIVMTALPPVPFLYPFKFIYNIVQVMLCSYMCIEAGVRAWDSGYTLTPCNEFNHQKPPIAFILYVFYLSKILDFADTVFIIPEKRWKQLSFLHVYHHFSIFMVSKQMR